MEVNEVVIVIIGGTLIMLILMIFIISFFFIHSRRQQAHKLEKAAMAATFNEEILTAKNEVQENTMKHIARELHDNIGQLLSLVKIQLNNIDEENPGLKRVTDSREYLNKALTDLRSLSKTLNSENILQAGLVKAIAFELERLEKTGFVETSFENQCSLVNIEPKISIIVFRIFQEMVQNVIKHANAKKLSVSLYQNTEVYTLELTDDGQGFEVEKKFRSNGFQSGSGLANLKNRAELINGKLDIASTPGQGTTLKLSIPINRPINHDESSPG
ncbi:sensor histidine kinase [Jiulongibacter sediminis]|jgi:signal transduction histidine kinase|uniref:sensor histidine kinase n=1 Tax=Jiulongibacter sediminis TaxID=1605367 RepID=UPI0026EF1CAE|nr:sensor histidine kinase [Jiulongibacter sediminis]